MQLVARKISLPNKTFVCVSMWVVVLAHGYGRGELLRVVRPSGFTAVLIRSQNIGNSVVSGRPAVVGYFSSIPKTVRRRFVSLVCQLSEDRQNAPGSQSPVVDIDRFLSDNNVAMAVSTMRINPSAKTTLRRFYRIFDAIEYRTRQLEENVLPIRPSKGSCLPYPSVSRARTEMCDMYALLKEKGILRLFDSVNDQNYPASGCKTVGPALLEMITGIRMAALTPNRAKTPFLFAGILLATIEEASSLYTGIPLSELVFGSLVFAIVDRIFANGSFFEMFIKLIWPGYSKKILQHEAGHFLAAYLLGCPVEGCVLSSFAAMNDYRFGGPFTSVSAGTSFFDPVLSDQVNNMKPLSRSIIDRFSVVAMAGIAAEALNFGRADGGAGDEVSLVRFLSQLNPSRGRTQTWDTDMIRNQARWGVAQGILLIKLYRPCYDALVKALEREGKLGHCIYAIEKAGRENGLRSLPHPVGYIRQGESSAEWELHDDGAQHGTISLENGEADTSSQNANQIDDADIFQ